MACDVVAPVLQPGWRRIVFTIQNESPRPAAIIVARDEHPMGAVVGTADPASVPAGATIDVTVAIPPESGWAIFVNPRPETGPMFVEADIPPTFTGRAPLTIFVDAQGNVGAGAEGDTPGWMGEP